MAADQNKPGKVLKVLFFDEAGEPLGESASTQIPEDPFASRMGGRSGIQEAPFSLEQLLFLSETHPIHSAALEQKTADVIGQGWEWEALEDDADETERDEAEAWFKSLAKGEQTMEEILQVAWEDKEKLGQGMVEIVRDSAGEVAGVYHVPAHTCRFHRDGVRIAQIRGEKVVWFKRWGAPTDQQVNRSTGSLKDEQPEDKVANELLVFQKPTSRSTWYGIPGYVAVIGWISLALAVRDDNLLFFANRREPRWAVILTNMEEDDDMEEALRRAFTVDLKSPHRNILIPISGNGKVHFEKLSNDRMDGSFEKLGSTADAQILVGHRMPPERLGLIKVGSLGGNVAIDASRVYREGVIEPSQKLLGARINRFIDREFKKTKDGEDGAGLKWVWVPKPLDLADETKDVENAVKLFLANIVRLNEARARIGEDPIEREEPEVTDGTEEDPTDAALPDEAGDDEEAAEAAKSEEDDAAYIGDMFHFELTGKTAGAQPVAEGAGFNFGLPDGLNSNSDEATEAALQKIDAAIAGLMDAD